MRLTRENIASFCSNIDLDPAKPTIDLRPVESIGPFAVIYLGAFVRYWNSQGKLFTIEVSRSGSLRRYLDLQNFWDRFNFEFEGDGAQPKLQTVKPTSFEDIVPLDIVAEPRIAEDLEQWTQEILQEWDLHISPSAISTIVVELIDNAVRHSRSHINAPACMIFQLFPDDHYVEVALADSGVGIRQNLSAKYHVSNDRAAVVRAFEDGVTSKDEGGTGLSTIMENVERLDGSLFLSTGEGYVIANHTTKYNLMSSTADYNLPGVQVQITIPLQGAM